MPRFRRPRLLAPALLLPLAGCAASGRVALGPLVADRPDFTESSTTVARGFVQLESGTTYTEDGASKSASLGEVLVRVGVASRAELRLGVNSYAIARDGGSTVRGFEDASVGAKVKLLQGGGAGSARPTVAILVGTSIPTGASPLRSTLLQPRVKTAWSWVFTDRLSLASNLNYSWIHEPRHDYGQAAASTSFAVGLSGHVGSFVEYFACFPQQDGLDRSQYASSGLTLVLNDDLQLDARAGRPLRHSGNGHSFFVGVGLSRRF